MHITFVKKILEDGSLCKKCQEVSERMQQDGVTDLVNEVLIADTRDASSVGMQLAAAHQVERAPFFIVEKDGKTQVFDVYFKLRKFLTDQDLLAVRSQAL